MIRPVLTSGTAVRKPARSSVNACIPAPRGVDRPKLITDAVQRARDKSRRQLPLLRGVVWWGVAMGRPERPLNTANDPVAAFAHDLRELRRRAGNPSYRELAHMAMFAPSVLSNAASGYRLPTLPVTLAFVAACGGDRAAWERRWRMVASSAAAASGTAVPVRGAAPVRGAQWAPAVPQPCAPAPAQVQAEAAQPRPCGQPGPVLARDRKSTRLNSSHVRISYAV